jgi:hypothetical protein
MMLRRLRYLPAFLVFGMVAARANERLTFGEEGYEVHWRTAITQAVGALPIDPKDGDQIRVWFDNVMGMEVTGYIVTRDGAWLCRLQYENNNGDYIVVHSGKCSGKHRYPARIAKAMELLAAAPRFDGKNVGCETMDGWQADVEGIFDGKRFVFTAMNTNDCKGEEVELVDALVNAVSHAFYKHDE